MLYDGCIIGGGPAGLMAAARIARSGRSCILLEKMEKTGRKLRISGKGRCNVTNIREEFCDYIVHGGKFVEKAVELFSPEDTVSHFESLGVALVKERGGRVFPESGKAWDIAQAMVDDARDAGAKIEMNAAVTAASKNDGIFRIETERDVYQSKTLLIATGGASYPSTGSTGDGYRLAWKFGHTIVPLRPALTHLTVKGHIEPILLRNVEASVIIDGKCVSKEFGEVEFNDRGMAGAAILPQSLAAVDAVLENQKAEVALNLKPSLQREQIIRRCKSENTGTAKDLVRKFVPWQLTEKVLLTCCLKGKDSFPEEKYSKLAETLKKLSFDVIGYGDFEYAIVTAGGVSLEEINAMTMESKICDGLYFAGEVIDIDGRTGGYNIQLALSTAALAADSIVSKL